MIIFVNQLINYTRIYFIIKVSILKNYLHEHLRMSKNFIQTLNFNASVARVTEKKNQTFSIFHPRDGDIFFSCLTGKKCTCTYIVLVCAPYGSLDSLVAGKCKKFNCYS